MSKPTRVTYPIRPVVLLVAGAIALAFLTGCEPLRKKFTRKSKKEQTKEIIPLLEPVEYPAPTHTAEGLYRRHYSLWQVWHKDLMTSLLEGDNDKRVVYLIDQLMFQLQEMQKLLVEEKRPLLTPLIDQVAKLKADYDRPAGLRNKYGIERRAVSVDRDVRKNFCPKKVRGILTEDVPEEE